MTTADWWLRVRQQRDATQPRQAADVELWRLTKGAHIAAAAVRGVAGVGLGLRLPRAFRVQNAMPCDTSYRPMWPDWLVVAAVAFAGRNRVVSRSTFVTWVRQTPRERVQVARRLRAAPPAPLTERATVRTQTREGLQEAFEAARLRSRRALLPAVRAGIGVLTLIHRLEYQPAPSSAMNQAQQARERNGSGVAHCGRS